MIKKETVLLKDLNENGLKIEDFDFQFCWSKGIYVNSFNCTGLRPFLTSAALYHFLYIICESLS